MLLPSSSVLTAPFSSPSIGASARRRRTPRHSNSPGWPRNPPSRHQRKPLTAMPHHPLRAAYRAVQPPDVTASHKLAVTPRRVSNQDSEKTRSERSRGRPETRRRLSPAPESQTLSRDTGRATPIPNWARHGGEAPACRGCRETPSRPRSLCRHSEHGAIPPLTAPAAPRPARSTGTVPTGGAADRRERRPTDPPGLRFPALAYESATPV